MLKLIIMGRRKFYNYQSGFLTIFDLWGRAGSGKSTFFKLLQLLAYSNCSEIRLNDLGHQFGRSNLIGSAIHLFNNVDYTALTMKAVSDLKKITSNESISVAIKHKHGQPVEVHGN